MIRDDTEQTTVPPRRGFFAGTSIRYLSLTFVRVICLAALMTGVTVVTAAAFSMLWLLKGGSGRRESRHGGGAFELVCISHVPWEEIWQRNQQTMSRLAKSERVLYVRSANTIEFSDNLRYFKYFFGKTVGARLFVLSPVVLWGDTRSAMVRRLNRWILLSFIRYGMLRAGFTGLPLVLWFYFPRSENVCGGLGERLVVYDIQDEYSTWTNATPDVAARERRLLQKAHLVFTGTNSLCKKKRSLNQNMHFIQNGVESEHFSLATKEGTGIPDDLSRLPRPVIGYFGLIGDRIDTGLLSLLADRHPEWSIALVGPVRDDLCTVPVRGNIHLLGQRDYSVLPGYLKGFDVAVIPYLLNPTTMDLNPTKLLEYLAGGKPVVSTAMTDVVELFSDYVGVAHDPEEFLALTERAVEAPDEALVRKGIEFARGFTWEAMAARMRRMICEALQAPENGRKP